MRVTRREFLGGMAVFTLAACSTQSSGDDGAPDGGSDEPHPITPPDDLTESAEFPLGISIGDLSGDRAVLWTQYAGTAPLAAFVWEMAGDRYIAEHGPLEATPAEGGYVHVAINGLVAGARYRYAFVELAGEMRVARSRVGRFRAPIGADAMEPLTFGAICCTEKSRSPGPIARASERTDLDGFLFCGDNSYCDGAVTVDDYRAVYAAHFGRPEHVALRANNGMYITWDDHEVKNNWNPESIDEAQLAAAFQSFFEHAPVTEVMPRRIWRSARWGKTLEIFVLDCRSERKPSTIPSSSPHYISSEQMAWFKAGLAASTATFKLIINSVPITQMPLPWNTYPVDRWDAYGAQRTEILRYIDDNHIGGVLWLSGDFHLAFISHVSPSGAGANQREVLCGPGGQSPNSLVPSLTQPQFSFATGTNNYTTLHFDPASRSVTVTYIDGNGTKFHEENFVP
ncbi:MAG TPA: alkaline phosphatase D family protein [Kofleriaceae bacterium]|nr:alkaline phosphatase D family protein [Kofleriaceae bacterium]